MVTALSNARSQEAAYLSGVRANLDRYGADLAAELAGVARARSRVAHADERKLVRDRALSGGVEPDAVEHLPVNGELWVRFSRGWRRVLHVFVKSFAAWQCLRAAGCGPRHGDDDEVAAYVESRLRRAGRAPCLFVLFAPGGWPASVRQRAHAREADRLLLCRTDGEAAGLWCDILDGGYGWHTWLCLTPMSLERRIEWCAARLEGERALRRDGVIALDEAVMRLGLPTIVGERLVEKTCSEADGRHRLRRTSDGTRYLERTTR